MADSLNDADLDTGTGVAMDLLLGPDGDLAFSNGDVVLVRGDAGVRQEARIRLSFWLGEWFLDLTAGIDFKGRVFTKPANPVSAQSAFRTELRRTTRVRAVRDVLLEFSGAERRLAVSFTALTVDGATVDGTVSPEV